MLAALPRQLPRGGCRGCAQLGRGLDGGCGGGLDPLRSGQLARVYYYCSGILRCGHEALMTIMHSRLQRPSYERQWCSQL